MLLNNKNKNTDDIAKLTLPNGVRIVSEKVPGMRSVALGIWVGAGSRHENKNNSGISHFIEHLMFKGTERRTAAEIAEALDAVGGQLNAFTTKEYTCYYAKTMDEHFDLALDVLADMFFNSKFTEQAIEKERGVIEEEIKMYEDTPDELIHDLFMQTVWPEHPLGKPILGSVDSLRAIDRDAILRYLENNYLPGNLVIAAAGNLDHHEVQDKIGPLFEGMSEKRKTTSITPPGPATSKVTNLTRETGQVQICLGTEGLPHSDERLYGVYVLNSILGGGLSSRLVQTIREERGLAYSVYTYHTAFYDTGLFTFYAGTSPAKHEEVIQLLADEIRRIVKDGITAKELERTKEQIKGSLYLGLESVSGRMTRLGRTELCLNRIVTPEEVVSKVQSLTLEDIHSVARQLFGAGDFSLSTIGPLEKPVDLSKYVQKQELYV